MVQPTGQHRISGSARPKLVCSCWEAISHLLECSPVRGGDGQAVGVCPGAGAFWDMPATGQFWFPCQVDHGKVIARPQLQCHGGTVFQTHGWGRLHQTSSNPYNQPGWLQNRQPEPLPPAASWKDEGLIITVPGSQERCFKEFWIDNQHCVFQRTRLYPSQQALWCGGGRCAEKWVDVTHPNSVMG